MIRPTSPAKAYSKTVSSTISSAVTPQRRLLGTKQPNISCMHTYQKASSTTLKIIFNLYYIILEQVNKLPIQLCKYDTPQIKKLRKELFSQTHKLKPTYKNNTHERKALRRQIIKEFFQERPGIKRTGNLYIVLGLSGTGKSHMCEKIAKSKKAFHIDIDSICCKIPEYKQNTKNYFAVFLEGDKIRKKIFNSAVNKGYDIVYEDVGLSSKELLLLCKQMKARGYKIHLNLMDLPLDKSVERIMTRYQEDKRFIDPLFNYIMNNVPKRTYKKLIRSCPDLFKNYSIYSNDVPKGTEYKLVTGKNITP